MKPWADPQHDTHRVGEGQGVRLNYSDMEASSLSVFQGSRLIRAGGQKGLQDSLPGGVATLRPLFYSAFAPILPHLAFNVLCVVAATVLEGVHKARVDPAGRSPGLPP